MSFRKENTWLLRPPNDDHLSEAKSFISLFSQVISAKATQWDKNQLRTFQDIMSRVFAPENILRYDDDEIHACSALHARAFLYRVAYASRFRGFDFESDQITRTLNTPCIFRGQKNH